MCQYQGGSVMYKSFPVNKQFELVQIDYSCSVCRFYMTVRGCAVNSLSVYAIATRNHTFASVTVPEIKGGAFQIASNSDCLLEH